MSRLEELTARWEKLADELKKKAGTKESLSIEWKLDKAFMEVMKERQRRGIPVDMAQVRRCIGGIE